VSSSSLFIFWINGAEGCMYGSGLGSSMVVGGEYISYSLGDASGIILGFSWLKAILAAITKHIANGSNTKIITSKNQFISDP